MTNLQFRKTLLEKLCQSEIPSLNGLRALAVLTVIAHHNGLLLFGLSASHGVMLFFVLSGFLITWLLLKEYDRYDTVSFFNFYIRRSLRIFPAFYLYWGIVVCATVVSHKHTVAWGHAVSALFYYNNYYYAFSEHTIGYLQHAWSLAVEEQFYLIWPGLFLLLVRSRTSAIWLLTSLLPLLWVYRIILVTLEVPDRYLYRAFETRADQLFVGCLLAFILHEGLFIGLWKRLCHWGSLLAVVACLEVSLALSYLVTFPYKTIVGFALEPLLMAILLVQTIALRPAVLNWSPVQYLGRISYGMYLYHELGSSVAHRILGEESGRYLLTLTAYGLTVLFASLSYHFIETKFLALKRQLQRPQVIPERGTYFSAPSLSISP